MAYLGPQWPNGYTFLMKFLLCYTGAVVIYNVYCSISSLNE